jgi:HEAT repeat protein
MTLTCVEALFRQTLAGDYDDDLPWAAVDELRTIGTDEVFRLAAAWCRSPEALCRARGADILAQIGRTMKTHANTHVEESFAAITALMETEKDERALSSAISALGHIGNPASVPLIIKWGRHQHGDVRHAVAFALGSFPDDLQSVQELIALMQDNDPNVRDWATFGLGVLGETDTPEIREALMQRTSDTFENARMEAFEGLGKRKDTRIIPGLLTALSQDEVFEVYVDAARQLLGLEEADCQNWDVPDYVRELRMLDHEAHPPATRS